MHDITLESVAAVTYHFADAFVRENVARVYMPDSHKFVHYHWIRVYINHARVEIVRVGIRYSLFQKQEKKLSASIMRKNRCKIDCSMADAFFFDLC